MPSGAGKTATAWPAVLTQQQVHVMELLAQGFTNDAVARNLFVSPETVKSHVRNIYQLDISNRAEAVGRFFELDHPG